MISDTKKLGLNTRIHAAALPTVVSVCILYTRRCSTYCGLSSKIRHKRYRHIIRHCHKFILNKITCEENHKLLVEDHGFIVHINPTTDLYYI
jgi:hypothetical protein